MHVADPISLVIAVLLVLLSSLIVYMTWYVIHGRKVRSRKAPEADAEPRGDKKHNKTRWGVDKDSYCYPSINDVMGFEFVKVVKVDDAQPAQQNEPNVKPSWEESRGAGLMTVSSNETTQEREEDEPFPEADPWTGYKGRRNHDDSMRRRLLKTDTEETIEPQESQFGIPVDDEGEDTEVQNIHEMMSDGAREAFGEWNHDEDFISDDKFDDALNDLVDNIEEPEMNAEQLATASKIEDFTKLVSKYEQVDNTSQVESLLADPDEEEEYEEEPEMSEETPYDGEGFENEDVDYSNEDIDESNMEYNEEI